jgi:hypothetical protein
MSDTQPGQSETTQITAHDVLDFLRNNPKFLSQHPEAVDYMHLPKRSKDKSIADFQSYMIDRLKADKEEVIGTAKELVETARSNMNNQHRIHRAVLRLLEARTFDEFIAFITTDLATILDTDLCVLVVEANGEDIPHIHATGIRVVPQGTIDHWMQGQNVLLQSDIQGIEAIYGGGAMLVRSQALLRVDISMDTPPAILAFGSRDSAMFEEGQATDQVAFLARVVERAFRQWLHLPH